MAITLQLLVSYLEFVVVFCHLVMRLGNVDFVYMFD